MDSEIDEIPYVISKIQADTQGKACLQLMHGLCGLANYNAYGGIKTLQR